MEKMIIIQRLLGSLIDKILILILFVIVSLCISEVFFVTKVSVYTVLLDNPPSSYYMQDESSAIHAVYGNKIYTNLDWSQYYKEIRNQPELMKRFEGKTLFLDLQITGLFILVNFAYYLLWGWIYRASLGKFLCGFIVVSKDDKKIQEKTVIKRCLLLLLLMIVAVSLRFAFDTNYYITILFFFLIVDTSVLLQGRSSIDIMTNTYVVKRKSIEDKI